MIFIVGTNLTEDQLPSFTEYKLYNDDTATGAKVSLRVASDLTVAYINKKFESVFAAGGIIPKEVHDKFVFFNTDEEVLRLINGESETDVVDDADDSDTLLSSVEDNISVQSNASNANTKNANNADTGSKVEAVQSEDVKTDNKVIITSPTVKDVDEDEDIIFLSNSSLNKVKDIDDDDDFEFDAFKIPASTVGNYDAVAAKLEAKERQLEQYKARMTEKINECDDIIRDLEADRDKVLAQYEAKIKEAQEAFTKAQTTINSLSTTSGKYHTYAERHKMMLSEIFDDDTSAAIKALGLDLMVMFAGGAVYDMQCLIHKSIDQFKENYVYIDLTGETYFDMVFKKKFSDTLQLFDEMTDNDVELYRGRVLHRENADIIAENLFHDILFLDADWLRFFTNIKRVFGTDKKIVLLLGAASSFSVAHTISRLSMLFNTYIHFKCSYAAIKSVFNHLKFYPNNRNIKVVATGLFDEASGAINKLGEKYAVITSPDEISIATIDKR